MGPRLPTRNEIRAAVRGSSGPLDRRAAFALLVESDDPERETLLAAVAGDPAELIQERSAAAITLSHIPTAAAVHALTNLLQTVPPEVLPDVLRSLGRIGGPADLESIDPYQESSVGSVATAARFAGSLIAHRWRLSGHDLPLPSADELLPEPGEEQRLIAVTRPSAADARAVLVSLGREAYGVELDENTVTRLRCGTDLHTVCINREFVAPGSAQTLLDRKSLLALVGLESREGAGHSVSYIILTVPLRTKETVGLLAPRCSGRPALAGSARVAGDEIRFSLRAIDRPGARAVALDGSLERGHLTMIQAVAATRRRPAPSPAYLTPSNREPSA